METIDRIEHEQPIQAMHTTVKKGIGQMSRPHTHDSYEIYYLVKGERYYFIENQTYLVKEGMVVLIQPHVIHRTIASEEAAHERLLINIEPNQFSKYVAGFMPQNWFQAFEQRGPILLLPLDEQASLYAAMMKVYHLLQASDEARFNQAIIQVLLILNQLAALSNQGGKSEGAPIKHSEKAIYQHIKEIATYINHHYQEDLSLKELSEVFYISPSYLSRSFKKVTGFHVKAYINQVRVLEAEKLLIQSEGKIGWIGEQVGYKSDSHFGRAFKQIKGVSPRKFRKDYIGRA